MGVGAGAGVRAEEEEEEEGIPVPRSPVPWSLEVARARDCEGVVMVTAAGVVLGASVWDLEGRARRERGTRGARTWRERAGVYVQSGVVKGEGGAILGVRWWRLLDWCGLTVCMYVNG